MKKAFPISKRPLEYVTLFVVEFSTREGPAFMYVAYDPFLDKLFNLSVEREKSSVNLLKSIYFLAEDPLFTAQINQGFTLVLDDQKELTSKIESILQPINGTVLFDKSFNDHLANPIFRSLLDFLERKKGG